MGINVDKIKDLTGFNLRSTYKNGFRDAAATRNLLLDVANDSRNLLGTDARGNTWHALIQEDGSQVWTQSRNGKIFDAGINESSRTFDPETGLSRNLNN